MMAGALTSAVTPLCEENFAEILTESSLFNKGAKVLIAGLSNTWAVIVKSYGSIFALLCLVPMEK